MKLFGTAVVLAGGKSTRMGFDKAFLKIDGKWMIEMILEKLHEVYDQVIIVTNKPETYKGLKAYITADILKNAGPLGGIHAGLKASASQYVFMMACDMPVISLEYARYMMELASGVLPDAVISRKGDWFEPFHALYSKGLVHDIEEGVLRGRYKIFDVLKHKRVIMVDEDKVREYSPELEIFVNLNDIKDLQRYDRLIKAGGIKDGLLQRD